MPQRREIKLFRWLTALTHQRPDRRRRRIPDRDPVVLSELIPPVGREAGIQDTLCGTEHPGADDTVAGARHPPGIGSAPVDIVLFEIENHFVIGYGLDYKEYFRDLNDVYIVENDDFSSVLPE